MTQGCTDRLPCALGVAKNDKVCAPIQQHRSSHRKGAQRSVKEKNILGHSLRFTTKACFARVVGWQQHFFYGTHPPTKSRHPSCMTRSPSITGRERILTAVRHPQGASTAELPPLEGRNFCATLGPSLKFSPKYVCAKHFCIFKL